jgi:hypothetical protein
MLNQRGITLLELTELYITASTPTNDLQGTDLSNIYNNAPLPNRLGGTLNTHTL